MKILNAMVGVGLIIVSLYLLLIVGGPLFSTIEPAVLDASPEGDMAVDTGTMITRVNFVVFKVVPLVLLASGIIMTLMALFWEEYQTYEYQQ